MDERIKEMLRTGELVRCVECNGEKPAADFSIGTDVCEWCQSKLVRK